MSTFTAPSAGTFHFLSAPDAAPHRFEDCDDDRCLGTNRRGWFGWVAKGATVDPDNDPNIDPARFGRAGAGKTGQSES